MIDAENQVPEEELEELEELKDEDLDLESSLEDLIKDGDAAPENAETALPVEPAPEIGAPAADGQAAVNAVKKEKDKLAADLAATKGKTNELIDQVGAMKKQLDDRNGQYMRLYADFENYRKRTEREKEEEEGKISAKILKKLLPVVDDFERAQSQIKPKSDAEATIHNSYQSVYKQLVKCLKEVGITRMATLRQEFDPQFHEAIAQEPTAEFEEGTVMEELRPGYMLGDQILRHAMVKVAAAMPGGAPTTQPPQPEATANETDAQEPGADESIDSAPPEN
ncbi:Protein grpE [Thalassoporum mexicanum PCC 7367]|uniref:nucleotide exchange factor GrpE n=1 Tax=Thalassoporum mexicanum TaxID=3457544 RepID=UPI00029FAC80|nr:nucleotide exchange factor GrpE [Pseudanabaena sp. PCC 7367]AFY68769.1 Protein grpE [Pseudanabaena sp. PCC 7367]